MNTSEMRSALSRARMVDDHVLRVSAALRIADQYKDLIEYTLQAPDMLWEVNRNSVAATLQAKHEEHEHFWNELLNALREEHQVGTNAQLPSSPAQPTVTAETAPAAPESATPAPAAPAPAPTAPAPAPAATPAATAATPAAKAKPKPDPDTEALLRIPNLLRVRYEAGYTPLLLTQSLQFKDLDVKHLAKLLKGRTVDQLKGRLPELERAIASLGSPPKSPEDPENPDSPHHAELEQLSARLISLNNVSTLSSQLQRIARDNTSMRPAITALTSSVITQLQSGTTHKGSAWTYPPAQIQNALSALALITPDPKDEDMDDDQRHELITKSFGTGEEARVFHISEVKTLLKLKSDEEATQIIHDLKGPKSYQGMKSWKLA